MSDAKQIKCAKCGELFDAAENYKGAVSVTAQQVKPPGGAGDLVSSFSSDYYECPHCKTRVQVRSGVHQ